MENKEIVDILQTIVENMATKDEIKLLREEFKKEIKASETRTKIYIDHNVTKKMDALFDGYKLNHEKQWELEQRVDTLERQMDKIAN